MQTPDRQRRQPARDSGGKGLALKLMTGLYLGISALMSPPLHACGWWGDGESDMDDEAIVVIPDQSDTVGKPDVTSSSAEDITRQANRLRRFGPSGYAGALRLYRQAAKDGYAPAQNNLGAMYEEGYGVAADPVEAARWYRLAAEQDEPHAQHSLGEMQLTGRGVQQNTEEGLRWIERAARQNHPSACADLGHFFMTGQYTGTDFTRARYWLQKAAQLGYPNASADLETLKSLQEKHQVLPGVNPVE